MPNKPQNTPTASEATPTPGQPVRSEGLLPADQSDPNLQVAEEVALDLQSDQARRVGSLPPDSPLMKPGDAVAGALQPDPDETASDQSFKKAIGGAVPPSPKP